MNDVDSILKAILNLLDGLESAVKQARQELTRLIEESIQWRIIEAPRPVSLEDRAIKWLVKRLEAVREKHPGVRFEFVRNGEGLITALRYKVEDDEARGDVEAPIRWAFERASERPAQAQSRG
ncbi:MAG: hypothetical protein QXK89_01505 [Candidatus Bathyarchaeia archaeon]